jgi:hypothetical protein
MNGKAFGSLIATAIASLMTGSTAVHAADTSANDAKACYRKICGQSVTGHQGTCAGTAVEALKNEKDCVDAGGAWVTAAEAEKLKH